MYLMMRLTIRRVERRVEQYKGIKAVTVSFGYVVIVLLAYAIHPSHAFVRDVGPRLLIWMRACGSPTQTSARRTLATDFLTGTWN